MSPWTLQADTKPAVAVLTRVQLGLRQRKKLHARCVIALQGWTFRSWPTGPPLSEATLGSRRGSGSASVLLDSGHLRMSLTGRNPSTITQAEGSLNSASDELGLFGTSVPYAPIQNYGGKVEAKNVKFLAIPLTYEAKRARSPRAFGKPLAFIPLKGEAGGILVEGQEVTITRGRNKGGTRIEPRIKRGRDQAVAHYLLKHAVDIPARPFFPTQEQAYAVCVPVVAGYLAELVSGAGGGAEG